MEDIVGAADAILEIDLSQRTVTPVRVTERERRMYLGGKGLALKALFDRLPAGVDPLGEANILAIMTGPVLGSGAPCSGRFAAVTKSPLTGLMVSSSCGGPFGMALKTAGYEGILVSGCADRPLWVEISAAGAAFHDAEALWGLDTVATQQALAPSKPRAAMAIGPAGENGVRFANVAAGHRFFGRGGIGAVMGAKKLKGIVAVGGSHQILPKNPQRFQRLKKKAEGYLKQNAITGDRYRNFGTNAGTLPCNAAGILPIHNFRQGSHEKAVEISGEAMQQRHQTAFHPCKPCHILCGHKGTFADGTTRAIPEFETVGLLGMSLGIFDSEQVSRFNEICGRNGMDTISAGATLAWAMEAGEKGLIDTPLRFGAAEAVAQALEQIAAREGFGGELANGSRWLSEKYGGREFAMQVKGLELAAYDPRGAWGQGLAYAVANRGGCHLSAYLIALEVLTGLLDPYSTGAKAEFVRFFESVTAGVNSLHTCQFTMYAYTLEPPLSRFTPRPLLGFLMQHLPRLAIPLTDIGLYPGIWSAVTGIPMSSRQFMAAGDRIHVLERHLNTREGVSRKDDTLPQRLLSQGRADDPQNRTVPLEQMLDRYYRLRGYDANGIPTQATLRKLGIVTEPSSTTRGMRVKEKRPGRKWGVHAFLAVMLWFVGRAMQAAAAVDRDVAAEVRRMPERFCFALGVKPFGPWMIMARDDKGRLRYRGGDLSARRPDLAIRIKHSAAAALLFTFRESTAISICRNRLMVDGDVAHACKVVRILNAVETYLLPRWISRLAVKRLPAWSMRRTLWGRVRIYLRAVLGF